MSGFEVTVNQEHKDECMKENNINDDIKHVMYIIINNEADLTGGNVICQSCYSFSKVIRILEELQSDSYVTWQEEGEIMIVLKAKEEDLLYCVNNFSDVDQEVWCQYNIDIEKTQISPFLLTSVVFCPMQKGMTPDFIRKMKLY